MTNHVYFVHYTGAIPQSSRTISGFSEVVIDRPITSLDQVKYIAELIKSQHEGPLDGPYEIIITNYILMRTEAALSTD